jgi:hypothetical protein
MHEALLDTAKVRHALGEVIRPCMSYVSKSFRAQWGLESQHSKRTLARLSIDAAPLDSRLLVILVANHSPLLS